MKFSYTEKELIQFLFDYRLYCETEMKEVEIVSYLKSINGKFKEMFDATSFYHDDDRLTKREWNIIGRIYSRI